MESGLFNYPYTTILGSEKEVTPAKTKVVVKLPPREGYIINNAPTLSDFKQYAKQNKDIIVPYERLDKSVYVSTDARQFKASEQQYTNLYYLLQL